MWLPAKRILAWAARNERKLGALVFIAGFATDIVTFGLFPLEITNYFYLSYLCLTLVAIFVTHYVYSRDGEQSTTTRALRVFFPLLFQYCIGSLLSGTLIFYTRSGSVLVSWPFLLTFLLVFVGNEFFRMYKDRLVFQVFLFYLTLYAYVLFAFPYYTHTLSVTSFYLSSALSVGVGAALLYFLYIIGSKRFLASFKQIALGTTVATFLMAGAYQTGILPPLPLSIQDIGIYHLVTRTDSGYRTVGEPSAWYAPLIGTDVHIAPSSPLYAYSAVFAPTAFSTNLVHVWEHYDETQRTWVTVSKIGFPIKGGRDGGYRGYSIVDRTSAGKWRVSVLTESGQAIGRLAFTVVITSDPAPLIEELK